MRFAEPIKVLGSQSSIWTSRYSRTVLTRQTSGNKKLSPPLAAPKFVSFSACLLILVPSQLVRPVYSSATSSPLELLTSNAFALPRSIAPSSIMDNATVNGRVDSVTDIHDEYSAAAANTTTQRQTRQSILRSVPIDPRYSFDLSTQIQQAWSTELTCFPDLHAVRPSQPAPPPPSKYRKPLSKHLEQPDSLHQTLTSRPINPQNSSPPLRQAPSRSPRANLHPPPHLPRRPPLRHLRRPPHTLLQPAPLHPAHLPPSRPRSAPHPVRPQPLLRLPHPQPPALAQRAPLLRSLPALLPADPPPQRRHPGQVH